MGPLWASFGTWLLGQAPAMVVFGLWVASLHRLLKKSSERILQLEKRSDALSASLVEVVQSSSQERVERATNQMLSNEGLLRTTLTSLESALLAKQQR